MMASGMSVMRTFTGEVRQPGHQCGKDGSEGCGQIRPIGIRRLPGQPDTANQYDEPYDKNY